RVRSGATCFREKSPSSYLVAHSFIEGLCVACDNSSCILQRDEDAFGIAIPVVVTSTTLREVVHDDKSSMWINVYRRLWGEDGASDSLVELSPSTCLHGYSFLLAIDT